jgi:2-methylaconitate cis-trans-isomerase PrpF
MQRLVTEGLVRSVIDSFQIRSIGRIGVSIVDAGNALVFARAKDIGIMGAEINEIDSSAEMRQRLETIRSTAAAVLGVASSSEEALEPTENVPPNCFCK